MVNGNSIIRRVQWWLIPRPDPIIHRCLDQPGDRAELDLAGDERCDRDLVRGIVDCRCAVPEPQRLVSQPQPGEALEVRRLEGELSDLGQIELG